MGRGGWGWAAGLCYERRQRLHGHVLNQHRQGRRAKELIGRLRTAWLLMTFCPRSSLQQDQHLPRRSQGLLK